MARTVTVELEVDAQGAVKSVQAVNGELVDMSAVAERVGQDLRSSFQGLQSRAALAESGLEGVTIQAQQAAQASSRMNRHGGRAALVLQQFGQGAQDAAFGLQFAVNNIPIMLESFERLRNEVGSTGAAFGQIMKSVRGLGAVILAVNLIPLLGVLISRMDLFGDETKETSEELSEAEKRIRGVADELVNLGDIQAAQLREITEGQLPQLLSLQAGRLTQAQEQVDALEQQLETRRKDLEFARLQASTTDQEISRLEQLISQDQRRLRIARNQLEDQQGLFDSLNDQYQRVLKINDLSQDLQQIGVERKQSQEETTAEVGKMTPMLGNIFAQMVDITNETMQWANDSADLAVNLQDTEAAFHAINAQIQTMIPSMEEGFDTFHNRLVNSLDLTMNWSEETDEGTSALENFDVTAITLAAGAMGQVASGAKEASQAVQDLVANMARAAGAALIQSGNFGLGIPLLLGGELVGAFAHGGTMPRTGTALVGERGPELVHLPKGAQIEPMLDSQFATKMQAATGSMTRNVTVNNTELIREVRALRNEVANLERVMPVDEYERKRREWSRRQKSVGGQG